MVGSCAPSDGAGAGLVGAWSAVEGGGALVAAGVSPLVDGCGGNGGVSAQALTLSDEIKQDVDASRRARNGMNIPAISGGTTREPPIRRSAQTTRRNFGDVRVSPQTYPPELFNDCYRVV